MKIYNAIIWDESKQMLSKLKNRKTVVSHKDYEKVCKELEHYKMQYAKLLKQYMRERKDETKL